MDKTSNLEQALCDVRKASRLLAVYQNKVLDIVKFIQNKLDFPDYKGWKRFTDNKLRGSGSDYIKLPDNISGWDFLFSYVFEYYLGEIELEDSRKCAISVIQYSDTGYFDTDTAILSDVSTYGEEENSTSKFLFIIESIPQNGEWWPGWSNLPPVMDNKYACKDHEHNVLVDDSHKVGLYSIPMSSFVDEQHSLDALAGFCRFCDENGIAKLNLK
jgi:hypothetical protein